MTGREPMVLKLVLVMEFSNDLNGRYTVQARSYDGYNYSSIFSIEVEVTNEGSNRRPTASLSSNLNEVYVGEKIIFQVMVLQMIHKLPNTNLTLEMGDKPIGGKLLG